MDIWSNANRSVDATLEKREHAGPIHRSLSAPVGPSALSGGGMRDSKPAQQNTK
jgi:hypothetical protein